MTNSKPRVFFDSSVLFCAFCSKTGGSAILFGLVKKGLIVGFTSQTAIEETEKNLEDFNNLKANIRPEIAESGIIVLEKIGAGDIAPYFIKIHKKDAHIIAGARLTKSTHVLTLDKKHINNPATKAKFPDLKIVSPKELLEIIKD